MVQIQTKTLTLDEFLQLQEAEPVNEYINGQIVKNLLHPFSIILKENVWGQNLYCSWS